MSTKVRIPNRINPALSDFLSPEESQALVDAGYGCTLELIDLLNQLMWERVQDDGWTTANKRLLAWLDDRVVLLPENESTKLALAVGDLGDLP